MRGLAALTLFATVTNITFQSVAEESIEVSFMLDELEYLVVDGADPIAWSAAVAVGSSERQARIVSEGTHSRGSIEEHEVHAYIAQAVSKTANIIVGWRGDLKPTPDRDWGMLGIEKTWAFDIETSMAAYLSGGGDSALRLKMGREWLLAPGLKLVPELETNAFGETDLGRGVGSGHADIEIAVRLFYTLSELATAYAGAIWAQPLGNTQDIARTVGDGGSESMIVLGLAFEL